MLPDEPSTFRTPTTERPWLWRLEDESGTEVTVPDEYADQRFTSQGDAESRVGEAWAELAALLRVPPELELMAMYRLGYLPPEKVRPNIDWSSAHRKRLSQYVFRDRCDQVEPDADDDER